MSDRKKLWMEQCEAARNIEAEYGCEDAMQYLIGEKFLGFLELAEHDPSIRTEIPEFVSEIKEIFEPWQIRSCLEQARETEPFDPEDYEGEDAETIEMERELELRQSTADLLAIESAKQWLLGDDE